MNISDNITNTIDGAWSEAEIVNYSQPLTTSDSRELLNVNIADLLVRSFRIPLASSGMLLNFCVIQTLVLSSSDLKSKLLIANMLLADFLLSFMSSLNIIKYILYGFGITDAYINVCVELVNKICAPLTFYYQSCASLVLACDRLYAITAPLQYYTKGYPRLVMSSILVCTWTIPLALILPIFIIPYMKPLQLRGSGICFELFAGHIAWTVVIRSTVLIAIGMVNFCIYIILFMLVKRRMGASLAVAEARSTKRKTSLSLTVTYFIVHCTSLAFYLPGPIYSELMNLKSFQLNRSTHSLIRRVLNSLYMINPIVNPIILSLRIPSIKEKLMTIFHFDQVLKQRSRVATSMVTRSTNQESLAVT